MNLGVRASHPKMETHGGEEVHQSLLSLFKSLSSVATLHNGLFCKSRGPHDFWNFGLGDFPGPFQVHKSSFEPLCIKIVEENQV